MELESTIPTNSNDPMNHFIRVFCPPENKKAFLNLLQQAIYCVEEEFLIKMKIEANVAFEKKLKSIQDFY